MAETFPCPECSQLNTTNRTTCKSCGFDLNTCYQDADPTRQEKIIISDIDMPFGSMIVFMVKWALASIPAFTIISLIIAICLSVFTGLLAGLGSH